MKNLFSKALSILALAVVMVGCAQQEKFTIESYLALSQEGQIYPTAEQIALLDKVIPEGNYTPFEKAENREFWDAFAQSPNGEQALRTAYGLLELEPEVPISDETYRRANLEGNRGIYKPRYYRTMDRLEYFLLAECMLNDGTFIPQIETYSRAILAMKSWVHPNHDDKDNGVLEGRRYHIDLSARKFSFVLALVDVILGDKIDSQLSDDINEQIQRRVINTYLESCQEDTLRPENNNWIRNTNNWNSVCTSGTILTSLISEPNRDRRVAAIGSALNSMAIYMAGFGADGYCSEGVGYWNYGFGHYLFLAEILHEYTDGAIDLFAFDNPEKMVKVANFPEKFEIQNGFFAAFSDGSTFVTKGGDNFAYLMAAREYGSRKPTYFRGDESVQNMIGWRADSAEYIDESGVPAPLPAYTYFDAQGIIISRGNQADKFSVAIKAGHNGENHNHCDVGSYNILLESDFIAGDIGAPSYVAGAFHPDNPARSSWGHPVPRINNTLQSVGIDFKGEVLGSAFSEGQDSATFNLKDAYEIPALRTLERVMVNDKSGNGAITITDSFTAREDVTFGTAVMVNVDYKIVGNDIILTSDNYKVKVEITAQGGKIALKDEIVPVEKLRSGRKSYRIGVDFTEPLKSGSILVKYTPIK